jgi:hypothetical protein
MAEDVVTRDALAAVLAEQRAEWAEFRADMRERLATLETRLDRDLAQMEIRLTRALPTWAFLGGLAGGLIAAAAKIFD